MATRLGSAPVRQAPDTAGLVAGLRDVLVRDAMQQIEKEISSKVEAVVGAYAKQLASQLAAEMSKISYPHPPSVHVPPAQVHVASPPDVHVMAPDVQVDVTNEGLKEFAEQIASLDRNVAKLIDVLQRPLETTVERDSFQNIVRTTQRRG